jgi:hypothetical protein
MSGTRVLMHFNDGSTLTDEDLHPRELYELPEEMIERLTSVERVIQSRHLTILKSPLLTNFFVMSDAYRDWGFVEGVCGGEITLRSIGCHLRNSDPLIRVKFSMDPRTMDVLLQAEHVKSLDVRGFAPRLRPPPSPRNERTKYLDDSKWTIINELPVREVWDPGDGSLACRIDLNQKQRIVAQILLRGTNCQLLVTPE